MLQLGGSLQNRSIMSLRTGAEIASVVGPIINPHKLKIEGFFCMDRFHKKQLILLAQDIRENGNFGLIVDDHDVLTEEGELIRLKGVIDLNFQLIDKIVTTTNKNRIGKVNNYAFDSESLYIQKLYVGQSILKSFGGGQLSVDRTQIIEITDKKIIIQEPLQGQPQGAVATV